MLAPDVSPVTSSDIPRRRLRNSRLTGSRFESVEDVVRWHGAMQAQDCGPAKWSIGQRASGLADAGVDEALERGRIVRTHVLRPTWHLVAAEDVRWMLALTGPRVARATAGRFRGLGLDVRTLSRCETLIAKALTGRNKLTRRELGQVLVGARIDVEGQRLPHILMHLELEAVICSGGFASKQHTYGLLDEQVARSRPLARDDAVEELTRRYLTSHGPATVKDLGWWSSLTLSDLKKALSALDVESETVEGVTLWSVAGASRPRPARVARLLQTYDEYIVGYTESRFLGDPRADSARAAWQDRRVPPGPGARRWGHRGALEAHVRQRQGPRRGFPLPKSERFDVEGTASRGEAARTLRRPRGRDDDLGHALTVSLTGIREGLSI